MANSSKMKKELLLKEAKTFRRYGLLTVVTPGAVIIFFYLYLLISNSLSMAVFSIYGIYFGFILSAVALVAGIRYTYLRQRRNWKYYVLPLVIPVIAGVVALSFYVIDYAKQNTPEHKRYNEHRLMCKSIWNFEVVYRDMSNDVRLNVIKKTNIDADALNVRIAAVKGDIVKSNASDDCDAALGMSEAQAKRVESFAPVVEQLEKDMMQFHSAYIAAVKTMDGNFMTGDLTEDKRYKWN